MAQEAKWYVVHTYSGYEKKVQDGIMRTVAGRNMQDLILEVFIPTEDSVEEKNGRQVSVQRKAMPGYVLVHMVNTPDTWYVVRNTRGVTGFVGTDSTLVPLTDEEARQCGVVSSSVKIDVELGDSVQIMSGSYEGSVGEVTEIKPEEGLVIVSLTIFGRPTPVELSFEQVKRI